MESDFPIGTFLPAVYGRFRFHSFGLNDLFCQYFVNDFVIEICLLRRSACLDLFLISFSTAKFFLSGIKLYPENIYAS
jgi:hypothetical protein